MSLLYAARRFDSSVTNKIVDYPTHSNEEARLVASEHLKFFLATAPAQCTPTEQVIRFSLPNGENISCVWWQNIFYITGTDIVRGLVHRFQLFGRPVRHIKKFEEGVFSDLRNLKPGLDAVLEEPKSELLEHLHRNQCVRTQKKQKVFFWFSVPHERLFLDALERDLKRERQGLEPTSYAMAEPALALSRDKTHKLFDQLRLVNSQRPSSLCLRTRSSTSSLLSTASSYVSSEGGGGDDELSPVESPTEFHSNLRPPSPTLEAAIPNSSDCDRSEAYSPAFLGINKYIDNGHINHSLLEHDTHQPDEHIDRSHSDADMNRVLAAMQQSSLMVNDHTEEMEGDLATNNTYAFNRYNHHHHHQQQAKIPGLVSYSQYSPHRLLSIPAYESLRGIDDSITKVEMPTSEATHLFQEPLIGTTTAVSMAFASQNTYGDALSHDDCRNNMSFIQTAGARSRSSSLSTPSETQPIEIHGRSNAFSSIHGTHHNRAYSADSLAPMPPQLSLSASPLSGSPLTNSLLTSSPHSSSYDPLCSLSETNRIRSFQCPIGACGRFFKRLEHLRRHMRTHTLERPYGCPACGKRFSRSDNLSQHRKTHQRKQDKEDFVDPSLATAQTEVNLLENDSDVSIRGIEVSSSFHNTDQGTQLTIDENEVKGFESASTLSCSNLTPLVIPQQSHSLGYGQTHRCSHQHQHQHQHHRHPHTHPQSHHHRQMNMNMQKITQSCSQINSNNSFEGIEFGAGPQLRLHSSSTLSALTQSRSFPSSNDLYNHRRALSSPFSHLQRRYRLVDVPTANESCSLRILNEGSNGLGEEENEKSIDKEELEIYCNELGMRWFGVKNEASGISATSVEQ